MKQPKNLTEAAEMAHLGNEYIRAHREEAHNLLSSRYMNVAAGDSRRFAETIGVSPSNLTKFLSYDANRAGIPRLAAAIFLSGEWEK